MIDFVVEHIMPQSFVMGGAIVGLWIVAHERGKAVDRLVDRIENVKISAVDEWRSSLKKSIRLRSRLGSGRADKHDAPGRAIARSVRRMTKNAK